MIMRRITLYTFALVLPLTFCSCGRKQPAAEKTQESAAAETAKVETKIVKRTVSAPLPKAKRAGEDYQEGSLKVRISAEEQEASANQMQSTEDHSNVMILDKKEAAAAENNGETEKKTIKKWILQVLLIKMQNTFVKNYKLITKKYIFYICTS